MLRTPPISTFRMGKEAANERLKSRSRICSRCCRGYDRSSAEVAPPPLIPPMPPKACLALAGSTKTCSAVLPRGHSAAQVSSSISSSILLISRLITAAAIPVSPAGASTSPRGPRPRRAARGPPRSRESRRKLCSIEIW